MAWHTVLITSNLVIPLLVSHYNTQSSVHIWLWIDQILPLLFIKNSHKYNMHESHAYFSRYILFYAAVFSINEAEIWNATYRHFNDYDSVLELLEFPFKATL